MRVDISRWTRIAALGVFASSVAMTGCSSGWKMPSMKMFSWSKKPSEAALAGTGPSSLTYPESPASKQTPNAIASAAAGRAPTNTAPTNSTASTASPMPSVGGDKSTPSAYVPPAGTTAAAAGYKPPAAGGAASMNGYPTGPYNTFGQPGAAPLATAGAPAKPATPPANQLAGAAPGMASGYASSNPYAPPPSASAGLPSSQAYGGAPSSGYYGSRPSIAPAIAAVPPSTTAPSIPAQPGAQAFAPPSAPPMPGAANGFASAMSAPPSGPAPGNLPVNSGIYQPVGTNAPSMAAPGSLAQSPPSNAGMSSGFAMPGAQPSAASNLGVPAQTAAYSTPAPNATSTASYRPGSTGRSTGYNFSQQGTAPGMAPPSSSSIPHTANGMTNPGYSLPPSSTLNR